MIVVTSGCQSGGLAAALSAMMPDSEVQPAVPSLVDPVPFQSVVAASSIWVTSLPAADVAIHLSASRSRARLITIPKIWFHGFHPDILHVDTPDGSPLGSAAGEYASAILTYGWKLGLPHEQIRRFYSGWVYDHLGYPWLWDAAMHVMRDRFAASDLDFASWYLPLVRRGTFMLTDNHPSVLALVQLARQVAELLGASAQRTAFAWEQVIPDGLLATSTVWPVYPELASRLGVPGGYIWRGLDGTLMDLDEFIGRSLDRYRDIDPDSVQSAKFVDTPLFSEVLGQVLGQSGRLAEAR